MWKNKKQKEQKLKKKTLIGRLCGLFLAAVTVFSVSGTAVYADYKAATLSDAKKGLPLFYSSLSPDEQNIYVHLRQGVMNNSEKISTIALKNADSYNAICELMLYNDDLAFNLGGISAESTAAGTTFTPTYAIDNFTYSIMLDEMEKKAEKIAKKARRIGDEYSRIVYIHDEIAENCEYFLENDPEAYIGYTHYAYGALVEGRAVCQGYSAAFSYVCRLSGIQCITVLGTSRGVSHSWNKVLCDNKWYNVDITWDDSVSNFRDNLTWDYFMLSDMDIAKDHTAKPLAGTYYPADETRDYYVESELCAENNSDAMKMLEKLLTAEAETGGLSATIKLADSRAYRNFINHIEYSDRAAMKKLLGRVKKASGAALKTNSVWYFSDPEQRTVTAVLVYEGSAISDYFNYPELIEEDDLKNYKNLGLKTDIPETKEEAAKK